MAHLCEAKYWSEKGGVWGLALCDGWCCMGHEGAKVESKKRQRGAVAEIDPRWVTLWWAGFLNISPLLPPSLGAVWGS